MTRQLPSDFALLDPYAENLIDMLYGVRICFANVNPALPPTQEGIIIDAWEDDGRIELLVMVGGTSPQYVRREQVMMFLPPGKDDSK